MTGAAAAQAPTASLVAAAWSCTRLPSSRASSIARSAWLAPWPGEPARGCHDPLRAQAHRIAPAARQLAPDVEQGLPQRRRVLTDRPVRRDRAPRDPSAAVEEPAERDRVVERQRLHVEVDDVGTGREREAQVAGPAHVHARGAPRRCQRAREDVGGDLAVERRLAAAPQHERGLVVEEHERAARERRRDRALDRPRPRAHDVRTDRERVAGRHAGAREGRADRQRARELRLDARGRARGPARLLAERVQAPERVGVERLRHRGGRAEGARHRDAAVGGDLDALDPVQRLRDEPLVGAARRELRHRRELGEAAQHRRRGRGRVAVREAPDPGCDACGEHGRRHEGP
ncbi:MAG: hypothetical protein KatS3mg009_3288 [Acidimicrobiia bacterium]|nr:MAG: hypothetical protein KatS3mg009_3288 [Acidimicrobiia bacterium]